MTIQSDDPLAHFIADVEAISGGHADDQTLAEDVAQHLSLLLCDPNWLREANRQPGDRHYRQHVLHVAPDGAFSVVAMVWMPGQTTPIHDHIAWCVVGVYQGEERQTRYRLYRDGKTPFLVATTQEVMHPGQTAVLVPPDEDIHQVTCTDSALTISIHVYGADIGALGTSINHRFDDLAIRAEASTTRPIKWRELYDDT